MKHRTGRPKSPAAKKKQHRVTLLFTREELLDVAGAANHLGVAVAAWCRHVVLTKAQR